MGATNIIGNMWMEAMPYALCVIKGWDPRSYTVFTLNCTSDYKKYDGGGHVPSGASSMERKQKSSYD